MPFKDTNTFRSVRLRKTLHLFSVFVFISCSGSTVNSLKSDNLSVSNGESIALIEPIIQVNKDNFFGISRIDEKKTKEIEKIQEEVQALFLSEGIKISMTNLFEDEPKYLEDFQIKMLELNEFYSKEENRKDSEIIVHPNIEFEEIKEVESFQYGFWYSIESNFDIRFDAGSTSSYSDASTVVHAYLINLETKKIEWVYYYDVNRAAGDVKPISYFKSMVMDILYNRSLRPSDFIFSPSSNTVQVKMIDGSKIEGVITEAENLKITLKTKDRVLDCHLSEIESIMDTKKLKFIFP